jgi:hypothetical protein
LSAHGGGVLSLFKAFIVVALLGLPFVVITAFPHFVELASSVPSVARQPTGPTPTVFSLAEVAPTVRSRFAPLDDTIPPTLAPPAVTPTPEPTAGPTPTGERVVIGNTGGRGAVLRADPVSGRPVAALREKQVLDVIERRSVPGSGDWVHVRTAEGVEGWVTGLVALPFTPAPAG